MFIGIHLLPHASAVQNFESMLSPGRSHDNDVKTMARCQVWGELRGELISIHFESMLSPGRSHDNDVKTMARCQVLGELRGELISIQTSNLLPRPPHWLSQNVEDAAREEDRQ